MNGSDYQSSTTPRGSLSTLRVGNYSQADSAKSMSPAQSPDVSVYQKTDIVSVPAANSMPYQAGVAEQSQNSSYGMGGGVGALIVWFFIIFVVSWLVLYALKPSFVLKKGTREIDTGKVLLSAAIISLIIIILIWLIKGCTTKRW